MRSARRALVPAVVALLVSVLISAGCSPAPAGSAVDSGSRGSAIDHDTGADSANRDQAVKFAECMRRNGVTGFPDPDAWVELTIDQIANGSSLDTNSAAFEQAIDACKDLEPPGFTGHKRSAQQQEGALEFAQCLRDNGVKDFPDPDPDGPLVDTNRIPSSAGKGGMSNLNAAMQACRDLAAGAGVTGP